MWRVKFVIETDARDLSKSARWKTALAMRYRCHHAGPVLTLAATVVNVIGMNQTTNTRQPIPYLTFLANNFRRK